MIYTVTFNPSLDYVVQADQLIRKNYCNEHKLSASELEW